MATSKKLTVVNTKPPPTNTGLFSYWGNQSGVAQQQGWYPAVPNEKAGYTIYRQSYNAPFNDVVDPKNPTQKGRIAVVGKRGNKMDIVIEAKDGNILHTIHQDVSPDFVQNYITNNQSTVAQRMDNVAGNRLAAVSLNKKKPF